MTINETIELLQSKTKGKLVSSISNYYPIKNRNILYNLSVNKDICYLVLSSNNRVVAIYDYLENKLIIECTRVDKDGHAISCYDKKSARDINHFIYYINIKAYHNNAYYNLINLTYFDYYFQNYKDELIELL